MNILAAAETTFLGLTVGQLIAIILPIAAIQVGLLVAALLNLRKQNSEDLRGGKTLWKVILIVCFFSVPLGLVGPIAYFTVGRDAHGRD